VLDLWEYSGARRWQLAATAQWRRTLMASLAHQLTQPLMAIRANAESALQIAEQNGLVASQIKEILRDIIRDDTRAAVMIQSLRSL